MTAHVDVMSRSMRPFADLNGPLGDKGYCTRIRRLS
jgi:hypothetical protein